MKPYPLVEHIVRPGGRVAIPRAPRLVAPGSTIHVVAWIAGVGDQGLGGGGQRIERSDVREFECSGAAVLAVGTSRVEVPVMGDFPFAHLACLPAAAGDGRRLKREGHGTSEGGGGTLPPSEPARRAGQTHGPQHEAKDAAS